MGKAFFDRAASTYDTDFTNSVIGKLQRERVYYWLDKSNFFVNVKSVFELNCGTGHDAEFFYQKGMKVWATDVSEKMIEVAQKERSKEIKFSRLDINDIDSIDINEEAIFSNFGGLNCISGSRLKEIGKVISSKQKKGDKLVWVIMPKFSLMESIYLLMKMKWKLIFRRNTSRALKVHVNGIDVPTYFHSPKDIRRILNDYHIKFLKPVAFFLPPSYLEPFARKYPKFIRLLNKFERIFGRFNFLSGWSDHFIVIAEKR